MYLCFTIQKYKDHDTYLLNKLINKLINPWSRVLLERLTGFQPVKKFPAFHETRRFITAFTTALHLSLSWATSIQSITPTSHFLKIHLHIILPSTPGPPKWSLAIRFLHQNPIYASTLNHLLYVPHSSNSSRFYHPNNVGWGIQIIKLLIM